MLNLGLIVHNQDIREIFSDSLLSSSKIKCQCVNDSVDSFLRAYRKKMNLDMVVLDAASLGPIGLEGITLIKKLVPTVQIMLLIFKHDEGITIRVFPGKGGWIF